MRRALLSLSIAAAFACAGESAKQFVPLAAAADVPADSWVVLGAPEPLRTPAYHHPVCFRPTPPFQLADDPMGVADADGQPVSIRAEVSGAGATLELPLSAYQGERVCFGIADPELEAAFESVRLRASVPIRIERVEWQSTDK